MGDSRFRDAKGGHKCSPILPSPSSQEQQWWGSAVVASECLLLGPHRFAPLTLEKGVVLLSAPPTLNR